MISSVAFGNMLIQVIVALLQSSGADSCTQAVAITTPGSLNALSGSCLQIPCSFTPNPNPGETFNITKPVVGVWMKSGHNFGSHPELVIFNSSKSVNTYPMNIIGDLKQKNCTTLFYNLTTDYTNTFYFRIENSPYKGSAICDPLQITINDVPWTPSIQISGEQKEKEVVTITCSAVTPCPLSPPKLTWDKQQDTVNVIATNSNGTLTTKIRLNLTLTDSYDGYNLTCSAAYPVTGGNKTAFSRTTLNVTYGPKNTSVSVSPSAPLSAGQLVTLSCSSRAKPPVDHFTWFRLTSNGSVRVSEEDTYSFNMCEGGDYLCEASNNISNQTSSKIQLEVTDVPWTPSIQISGEQKDKEVVTITCSAVTLCPLSPPKLTWDKQQDTVDVIETNSNGTLTTTIRLNLTLIDSYDGYNLTCSAAYPVTGGNKTVFNRTTLNVRYGPKNTSFTISPSGPLSAGQLVNLSCSSRAKPPVDHFTWFRNTSNGPVNVSEGDTYSFNLTEDGVYLCVASNVIGNESSPHIHIRITEQTTFSGSGFPLPFKAILGAGVGLLIVICLAVFVWRFKTKRQTPKDTQGEIFVNAIEEPTIHYGEIDFSVLRPKAEPDLKQDSEQREDTVYCQVQVSKTNTTAAEETVHYGEIDFSNLNPKVVPNLNQEETVYSQVQVPKTVNSDTQPSDGLDSLYSKVKKN